MKLATPISVTSCFNFLDLSSVDDVDFTDANGNHVPLYVDGQLTAEFIYYGTALVGTITEHAYHLELGAAL